MSFSTQARKSASLARSIKQLLGEAAYQTYKDTGRYNVAALEDARAKPKKKDTTDLTQADVKPDTVPTHGEDPGDFVKSLQAGDVVRDKSGQRIRVQKAYPYGLRLRDHREGVRDLNWPEIAPLGLRPLEEPEDGKGPAARRLGELRKEAEDLGVDTSKLKTTKEIQVAIGKVKALTGDELEQVDPQLAKDAKDLQDFSMDQPWRSAKLHSGYWDNDAWIAEEKLDGVRLKLHVTPQGFRTDSRRPGTKTRRFSEKSPNFPHLLALDIPELYGTVLDAEAMIPAESGVLPSGTKFHGSLSVSTAATNAGPETSAEIQDKFGPMQFWIFDIISHKGQDVSNLPAVDRRKIMEEVVASIVKKHPETEGFFHVTKQATGEDKLPFYESLIAKGGEGIIFKKQAAPYEKGKRSKNWMKLKRFQEIDAYVVGFVPGKAGNEGLVGALELAVTIDGKQIGIAAVSQVTEEERIAMTAPDGSLKREYYNRVLTFRGQQLAKNGRFRHAVFVGWRSDKGKEDIDGYEVRDELAALKVIDLPVDETKTDDGIDRVF